MGAGARTRPRASTTVLVIATILTRWCFTIFSRPGGWRCGLLGLVDVDDYNVVVSAINPDNVPDELASSGGHSTCAGDWRKIESITGLVLHLGPFICCGFNLTLAIGGREESLGRVEAVGVCRDEGDAPEIRVKPFEAAMSCINYKYFISKPWIRKRRSHSLLDQRLNDGTTVAESSDGFFHSSYHLW